MATEYQQIELELRKSFQRLRGLRVNSMMGQARLDALRGDLAHSIDIGGRGEGNSTVRIMGRGGMYLVSNIAEYDPYADIIYGIFNNQRQILPIPLALARLSGRFEVTVEAFGYVERILGDVKGFIVQ